MSFAGVGETMDVLGEGIKAVAVGVSGSKPIPENLIDPLIRVRVGNFSLCSTVLVLPSRKESWLSL